MAILKKRKIFLPAAVFFISFVGVVLYFARPVPEPEKISYGITFSKPFAEKLGLDWKALYTALLDDLGARKIRLPAYWDEIEAVEGVYDFGDLLWQVEEAQKRNAEIILAVGRKLPRWPECHAPGWLNNRQPKFAPSANSGASPVESQVVGFQPNNQQQAKEYQEQKLLKYIEETVSHFKNYKSIKIWQVENEPFLPFGECPELDKEFLEKEIEAVRILDNTRPVLVTDSGEFGKWVPAIRIGDIFGTTMYFQVYNRFAGYLQYPVTPGFFRFKSRMADLLVGKKPKLIIEFQMEPWNKKQIYETSIEEQMSVFSESDFDRRAEFVKKTGFDAVYFWGAEWWWWLKIKHQKPEFWEKAKILFHSYN